jgi:elongation factor Ts
MYPVYVNKEAVPGDYLAKEKEIVMEQMAGEKKPPEILEKIVLGKLNKHLTEICLEDQVFVKDPDGKTSVKNTLKKLDSNIKIKNFVRLQVGEGVEKKEANLAKEVQEMIQ